MSTAEFQTEIEQDFYEANSPHWNSDEIGFRNGIGSSELIITMVSQNTTPTASTHTAAAGASISLFLMYIPASDVC